MVVSCRVLLVYILDYYYSVYTIKYSQTLVLSALLVYTEGSKVLEIVQSTLVLSVLVTFREPVLQH